MLYRTVNWVLERLLRLLCAIDDRELERVPGRGPLILVINHINFLDAPLLYLSLRPRRVVALVKKETWKNPLLGGLANLWEAIPIHRGLVDRRALSRTRKALAKGRIVIVAPEGTRSRTGKLQKGHSGVVLLALALNTPILPVAHFGGEKLGRNLPALKRTQVCFRVGRSFTLRSGGREPLRAALRRRLTDAVMYQLAALLPPSYRGVYTDLEAAPRECLSFASAPGDSPAP